MKLRTRLPMYILLTLSSFTILASIIFFSTPAFAISSSAPTSVTVGSACTLSASPSSTGNVYNVAMVNNQYKNDIGKTRLTVFCNNNEGFAVYAVGYSNNEFGNSAMIASNNNNNGSSANIPTGTNTSGNLSQWAMKLEAVTPSSPSSAPTATITNNYHNFNLVPTAYTKLAEIPSLTNATIEASVDASYSIFISPAQPLGSYTGKVRYTVVHPASEIPLQPRDCPSGEICYWPNATSDVVDSMGNQRDTIYTTTNNTGPTGILNVNSTTIPLTPNSEATLWASNFKRRGYGFAGWSDKFDWELNSNDANGNGTGNNAGYHIYGPNQTITTPSDLDTKGLSLYAVWVKSRGFLQEWSGCSVMNVGEVTALTDLRDNDTYAVAKLADGKCWMIENLRLDHEATIGSNNEALAQGYAKSSTFGNFIGLAEPEPEANFNASNTPAPVANSIYYYSSNQFGIIDIHQNYYPGYRIPRYNSVNTVNSVANMTEPNQNIYSYGNYYNWPAAIADTGYYPDMDQSATATSLCPKGWRLAKGGSKSNESNSEFWSLVVGHINKGIKPSNYNNSSVVNPYYANDNAVGVSNLIRDYPNNFLYAGYSLSGVAVTPSGLAMRGVNASYWSSTASSNCDRAGCAYELNFYSNIVYPGTLAVGNKRGGISVRCLVGN